MSRGIHKGYMGIYKEIIEGCKEDIYIRMYKGHIRGCIRICEGYKERCIEAMNNLQLYKYIYIEDIYQLFITTREFSDTSIDDKNQRKRRTKREKKLWFTSTVKTIFCASLPKNKVIFYIGVKRSTIVLPVV